MITAVRYAPERKAQWDAFVDASKNGTFLFRRDYMEYHADRFRDWSLLFEEDGELVAILPASLHDAEAISHGGLTFGGVVCGRRMRTGTMLEVFETLRNAMRGAGVTRLTYKRVPFIYHDVPSDEDLYALFRNDCTLVRRDVSAAVLQADALPYAKGRKWTVAKSRKNGLTVGRSDDFDSFFRMESEHLRTKFGAAPVHTAEEMRLLAARFPENIILFTAVSEGRLLAGVLVYESKQVAHAQYIGATDEGFELCALDAVIDHLLRVVYKEKRYFDFGTSNGDGGRPLNTGLIANKESYGARAVAHEFFELTA